jgi:DNA-directed RNA polymerase omega subunit
VARVTIEDCLEKVPNRFALIHFAFQRVRQLRTGVSPIVQSKNKEVVVALREIATGKMDFLENDFSSIRKEIGFDSEKPSWQEIAA